MLSGVVESRDSVCLYFDMHNQCEFPVHPRVSFLHLSTLTCSLRSNLQTWSVHMQAALHPAWLGRGSWNYFSVSAEVHLPPFYFMKLDRWWLHRDTAGWRPLTSQPATMALASGSRALVETLWTRGLFSAMVGGSGHSSSSGPHLCLFFLGF